MKVIDLLNLLYEKKVPKKIKYNTKIYEYDEEQDDYSTFVISHYEYLLDGINVISQLNDEVEIIEDKPEKIEKIDNILRFEDLRYPYGENEEKFWKNIIINHNKINEVIDKLNYLLEKSDSNED